MRLILIIFILFSSSLNLLWSKDLFSTKEKRILKYYKSKNFFLDRKKELMSIRSQRFFRNILKLKAYEEKKKLALRIKEDPWKKLDLMDEVKLRKILLFKIYKKEQQNE